MPLKVEFTDAAERDLEQIYDYVELHDSEGKADYVLEKIERACFDLSDFPERGVRPRELSVLGIKEYREVIFKPYRIIYRVLDKVYIMVIADGRRDMRSLLQKRLLEID